MLTPPEGSHALKRQLEIERAPGRRLHLFGTESPHTSEQPFVIRMATVRSPTDVLDWIKTIASRGWGATPADLLTLGKILMDDLERRHPPNRL